MTTGIDAIAFDIAKLHLPIKTLAQARNIDPEKLEKGLGLLKMTLPDTHQDAVVFAANALTKLIELNTINPKEIARIYVGTESGIDSSKPIASFLVGLMEQKFGLGTFSNCDATDFTFACIAGVDALQNCLDFVRLNPTKKAIVVTTDIAKYDLESTGEYTQGAGALAMLVTVDPKIISFDNDWTVATGNNFDFFKPYRTIEKKEITGKDTNEPWHGNLEAEIDIHKDQPVFDGQYSNFLYTDKVKSTYFMLKDLKKVSGPLYDLWHSIIMHLPYAYQGRRMFSEIYDFDSPNPLTSQRLPAEEFQARLKEIPKSPQYRAFVNQKLQPAEIASSLVGNLYTGSVFMGLLSTLSHFAKTETDLAGKTFGFLAYGSGSKSKAFEGVIQQGWKTATQNAQLFETLTEGKEIDFDTYLKLHKKEQKTSVLTPSGEWILESIEKENPNRIGARYYKWVSNNHNASI